MSTENDKNTDEVEETSQAVPEPVTWINGFVPFYILADGTDVDKAIDDIQSQGFPVFYIFGERKTTNEYKDEKKITRKQTLIAPRVYKVVKNLVGSAVTEVASGSIGLAEIEPSAFFSLPGIPWSLIQDIDDFFRKVDDKFDTEAIVLFTYDDRYKETDTPSDGWGVVIPDQTNTAGSCDYKPESIVDQLPDPGEGYENIHVVGSAHSHPGMSAYCSGTDKADQASFDGIHITFGWKNGSRQTEFHIELQMGGAAYNLAEDYAFSGRPTFEENETIEGWVGHVKKKQAVTKSYGTSQPGTPYSGKTTGKRYSHLPSDLPSPSGSVQVILKTKLSLAKEELKKCPVCNVHLSTHSKKALKCTSCQSYIMPSEVNTINELIEYRKENGVSTRDLDLDDENAWKSVYLWEEIGEGANSSDKVTKLRDGRGDTKK